MTDKELVEIIENYMESGFSPPRINLSELLARFKAQGEIKKFVGNLNSVLNLGDTIKIMPGSIMHDAMKKLLEAKP